MKLIILFAIIVAVNAETSKWLDYRVRYSPLPADADVSAFFPIEKTLAAALEAGWIKVSTASIPGATTVCYSNKDLRVCPIYDPKGFIAGMQLAIPPSDVEDTDVPYDVTRFPVFEKKTINNQLYWTSTYYVVDPAVIESGGRPSAPTTGNGIWLKSGNSFIEIPTDVEGIKKTKYTWQNCIPNMGTHYYYNMTPSMDCENFYPYFLLVKEGNMIGLGWQVPGRTTPVERNWYENITGRGVKAAVPLGPECLFNQVDEFGVISVHMYFVNNPWAISCNQSIDSVVPLP